MKSQDLKGKILYLQKPSNKRIISVLLELLYHTTVDKKAYEVSNITIGHPRRTNFFPLCECIEYSNMNILILALAVCTHTRPL